MTLIDETYAKRRVLVTGHSGFKGTWLSTWLANLGADVAGLSLAPNTTPSIFDAVGLSSRCASTFGDIRAFDIVRARFETAQPEVVFHLAAQPLVRRSYRDPLETFASNVMGTAHVLEAARQTRSVKAVVVVTTDKVYANEEWPWPYRETDRLGGSDPYSASKACAELVTQVYSHNMCTSDPEIAIATARGGNVVGGGDWSEDRLVPDIVRAVVSGTPLTLRNPKAVRPWQHVLELCEGYLELGARLLAGEKPARSAWNFGPRPGDELDVGTLAEIFLDILGKPGHVVNVSPSPLKESQLLRLDISKSIAGLDWKPRLSARETLEWTARWYSGFAADPASAARLTDDQISTYRRRLADAA